MSLFIAVFTGFTRVIVERTKTHLRKIVIEELLSNWFFVSWMCYCDNRLLLLSSSSSIYRSSMISSYTVVLISP